MLEALEHCKLHLYIQASDCDRFVHADLGIYQSTQKSAKKGLALTTQEVVG